MPAPSLERLLDTQSIFETALVAYFVANGFSADSTFDSQSSGNMPDARQEITYIPGGSDGHQTPKFETPELDWFDGEFEITVQTDRAVVEPAAGFKSVHDERVAKAKKLMLRRAMNGSISGVTALVIPWHDIHVQAFSGQFHEIASDALDRTVLRWTIKMRILDDAWPAA